MGIGKFEGPSAEYETETDLRDLWVGKTGQGSIGFVQLAVCAGEWNILYECNTVSATARRRRSRDNKRNNTKVCHGL